MKKKLKIIKLHIANYSRKPAKSHRHKVSKSLSLPVSLSPFLLFPLIFGLLSLILLSCSDPKLENPFDANVSIAAPSNLSITQLSVTSCKLTWTDNSDSEQGFRIDRKKDNEDWQAGYAEVEANVTEFDETNLNLNSTYSYRVYGFAGDNTTTMIEGNISMSVPAPTNLTYDQLTITSIELNWVDNCSGEDGFKIDKKVGNNSWQNEYASVGENTLTWTDTNAEINEDLQYRVYAYSGTNESTSIETGVIDNTIPAPENLTYVLENISYPTADIHLDWDYSVSGIDGFKVKKNGILLSEIIPSGTTEWTDQDVNSGDSISYQVLAFVQNNNSPYSNEITVIMCIDFDNNIYETIQIGDQIWMAENLKVTHYRNGDPIPHLTDDDDWISTFSGAYCYYDNDPANGDTYGALYNWYAVEEDNTRGLAPEGWRIPTDDEWQILVDYLGGSSVAGGKMKEAGTAHWNSPNTGATNESGFTGLPGGYRGGNDGTFYYVGDNGTFWSATVSNALTAWRRKLYYDNAQVYRHGNDMQHGYSVRCLRDLDIDPVE